MKQLDIQRLNEQQQNINEVILWQYTDAEKIQALIQAKQEWNNENNLGFWYFWLIDYFNLRYASEEGMTVWALILNLGIYFLGEISPADYPAIGFENEVDTPPVDGDNNFYGIEGSTPPDGDGANFAISGDAVSSLTTDERRLLLMLRYFQITTRGTVTEINKMLKYIFGDGVYVTDNLDMTMTYVFLIPISDNLQEYLAGHDILPRPAGVNMNIAYTLTYSFGHADYQEGFTSNFTSPADYVP